MAISPALQDWYNRSQGNGQPVARQPQETAGMLARMGTGRDTQLAHVTPGEVVVPQAVAASQPQLMNQIANATQAQGGNPNHLMVGSGQINPNTGIQQFANSAADIASIYQTNFGRAPDQAGLDYWTAAAKANPSLDMNTTIRNGANAADTAAMNTIDTTNATNTKNNIASIYQTNFGRAPDQGGADYWAAAAKANPSLDLNTAIRNGANAEDALARDAIDRTKKTTAAGTSYIPAQADTATYTASTYTPTTYAVDPTTGTVAGQLNTDLSNGSPLMQQAATAGYESANARGMLNSSMGIGAAQSSMIAAATPIATSDANAYNVVAQNNASAENQGSQFNTGAINTAASKNADATNAQNQYNATATSTARSVTAANNFTQQQTLFDAKSKAALATINNTANLTQNMQNQVAGLANTALQEMTTIDMSDKLTAEAKAAAIKNVTDWYTVAVHQLSGVGAVPDVAALLDTMPTTDTTAPVTITSPDQFQQAARAAWGRELTADELNDWTTHQTGAKYDYVLSRMKGYPEGVMYANRQGTI